MEAIGPFECTIPCYSATALLGPSGNGKSRVCVDMIKARNRIYSKTFDKTIILTPGHDELYDEIKFDEDPSIFFVESISEVKALLSDEDQHKLLVLDDVYLSGNKEEKEFIYQLTARFCHHGHVSLLLTNQVVFDTQDAIWRKILRNIQQFVFVKNSDKVMLNFFSQVEALNAKKLLKWYRTIIDSKEYATFFFSTHRARKAAVRCRSSPLCNLGDLVICDL